MNNNFYVYGLYRPNEEKPFYIGKGHGDRYKKSTFPSKTTNIHKKNIINKIKYSGNKVISKILLENLTEQESFSKEIELIKKYGKISDGGTLVNYTNGGEGTAGLGKTDEWKRKIGIANTGKKHSDETKLKMRNLKLGKTGKDCPNSKPIIAAGKYFDSAQDAAMFIGVVKQTISNRARSNTGRFNDYYFINEL
ncbi:MAG: hypothetical protein H8D97_00465 [Proteobacteria bacterium]|nr:hypothetical protein [Pseudomonadota bacterium]